MQLVGEQDTVAPKDVQRRVLHKLRRNAFVEPSHIQHLRHARGFRRPDNASGTDGVVPQQRLPLFGGNDIRVRAVGASLRLLHLTWGRCVFVQDIICIHYKTEIPVT